MSFEKSLQENSPYIGEAIFLLVILGTFICVFTFNDIITHDFYSMPLGSMCYEGNSIPQCIPIQTLHNCPTGGDACIEQLYYNMITIDAFALAGLMVFIKLGLAVLFKRKINEIRILQSVIWGATPLVLLWTGWEDFLYYAVRHMQIPHNMDWLNNAGLFPYVDNYILHVQQATSMSLYIVMGIGFVIVSTMIYANAKMTKSAGLRTPI